MPPSDLPPQPPPHTHTHHTHTHTHTFGAGWSRADAKAGLFLQAIGSLRKQSTQLQTQLQVPPPPPPPLCLGLACMLVLSLSLTAVHRADPASNGLGAWRRQHRAVAGLTGNPDPTGATRGPRRTRCATSAPPQRLRDPGRSFSVLCSFLTCLPRRYAGVRRPADFLELDREDLDLVCCRATNPQPHSVCALRETDGPWSCSNKKVSEPLKKVQRRKLERAIAGLPTRMKAMAADAAKQQRRAAPRRQQPRKTPAHDRLYAAHKPRPAGPKELTPRPAGPKRSAAAMRKAQEAREAQRQAAKQARRDREEVKLAAAEERAAVERAAAKRKKAAAARHRKAAARKAAAEKGSKEKSLPGIRAGANSNGKNSKAEGPKKGGSKASKGSKKGYDSLGRLPDLAAPPAPGLGGWESTHTPRSPGLAGFPDREKLPDLSAHSFSIGGRPNCSFKLHLSTEFVADR